MVKIVGIHISEMCIIKTKEPNVEKKEKKKEKEKSEGSREVVCAATNLYLLTISKKLNNSSKKYWPDIDR